MPKKRKNKAHGPGIAAGHERGKFAARTHAEIAAWFGVSVPAVQQVEARALEKLRRHPLMLELAKEYGISPDGLGPG